MNSFLKFFAEFLGFTVATPPRSNLSRTIQPQQIHATQGVVQPSLRKTPPLWYIQRTENGFELPTWHAKAIPHIDDSIIDHLSKFIQSHVETPSASYKILQKLNEEDSSTKEITELANGDPLLAARILKCVNSAFFGLSGEVSSVGQAILLLGMNQLRILLMSEGLKIKFDGIDTELQNKLTLHAAISSTIALNLCKNFPTLDANTLRTVSLFHSMGRLLLQSPFADKLKEYLPQDLPLEHQVALLSAAFCQAWDLPSEIAKLLLLSPYGELYGINELPYGYHISISILSFAQYLAREFGFGDDHPQNQLDPLVLENLGISPLTSEWLSPEVALEMQKVSQLF